MLGFCVKCNRGKKKGETNKVEITILERVEIKTTRGIKHQVRGTCPDCGTKVTIMVKGDQETNDKPINFRDSELPAPAAL